MIDRAIQFKSNRVQYFKYIDTLSKPILTKFHVKLNNVEKKILNKNGIKSSMIFNKIK